nr:aminopeptidase [Deltaproteobacteria bacterium]
SPDASLDAGADAQPDGPGALGDILDEVRAIPGMASVTEKPTMLEGYRLFVLEYMQPVDHQAPAGTRFTQRMTLLHRDYAAPMIAYNSGYHLSTRGARSEITKLTGGNQLSLEHRFFGPSRPDPADWTKLDIAQAAADQHRITQALKARIYRDNKWLTTGASKGGMTSLFHRRFYPDDVDGTVAYVAPLDYPADQVASAQNRYFVFLENVGSDPACRQMLKTFQNTVLARRTAMITRMREEATFTGVLGEDRALEFAVEELPFIFWQYGSQDDCGSIPAATASDDDVFTFFDDTIGVASYGDDDLTAYLPYYHQSATQLGYPAVDESYLVGLLHPGEDTAAAYILAGQGIVVPPYDNGTAMQAVQGWIGTSGSQLLLIYGQNDPWTAGAVDLGAATDSFKLIVPGGNHGSSISTLPSADQATAIAAVLRWAGMPAALHGPVVWSSEPTAEQLELSERRQHHHR